jgi:hypothetical protein
MASKYNEILSNIKAAVPELSDPANMNPSQADPLIKIASGIAPTIDNTLTELTNTISIITDLIGQQGYCKPGYFIAKAKAYQIDSQLTENTETFEMEYETIDTTKQIITQAAFIRTLTGGSQFYINNLKVAKTGDTGVLEALSSSELSDFQSYMLNFDPPGSHVNVYSNAPNELNINSSSNIITYYYGYSLSLIKINIATMLASFRDEFTFNGRFFINDLCTYIKNNVEGIRNVSITVCDVDNVSIVSVGESELSSGYFDYQDGIDVIVEAFTYEYI